MNIFKTVFIILIAIAVILFVVVAVTNPTGFPILLQYSLALVVAAIPLFFISKALDDQHPNLAALLVGTSFALGLSFLHILPFETPSQTAAVCESCGNALEETDIYCSLCGEQQGN